MKNAFTSILLLSVVGLAVLLAGAFYFGAPLFGWIIMIAIFAVFIVEQALALKKLRQMSAESEIIDECERRHIYSASGDGVVAARIRLAERLLSKGICILPGARELPVVVGASRGLCEGNRTAQGASANDRAQSRLGRRRTAKHPKANRRTSRKRHICRGSAEGHARGGAFRSA